MSLQAAMNFIFGLIMNQGIRSESAWQIPKELKKRLGIEQYDLSLILEMGYEKLEECFMYKPCLHRYPSTMARNIFEATQLILDSFHGDPRTMWEGKAIPLIIDNLQKIPGIGPHKAKLGVVILNKIYPIEEWNEAAYLKIHQYASTKCPNLLSKLDLDLQYIFESDEWEARQGGIHV